MREKDAEKKKVLRAIFVEAWPKFLGFIDKLLEQSGSGAIAGSRLSIADLQFWNLLKFLTSGNVDDVHAADLDKFPKVKEYVAKISAEPRIAEWQAIQERRKKEREQAAAAPAH